MKVINLCFAIAFFVALVIVATQDCSFRVYFAHSRTERTVFCDKKVNMDTTIKDFQDFIVEAYMSEWDGHTVEFSFPNARQGQNDKSTFRELGWISPEDHPIKVEKIKHTLPTVDFAAIKIKDDIAEKPTQSAVEYTASVYNKTLFQVSGINRDNFGGGWLLGMKNFKKNGKTKLSSPEELGFDVIQPKSKNDKAYEENVVRYVREGRVEIVSIFGRSGSYYVEVTLRNTGSRAITLSFDKGQVFEQNDFRNVQNLALVGLSKYDVEYGQTAENRMSNAIEITIPANSTVTRKFECYCIDADAASPSGEQMNLTPLKTKVKLTSQSATWSFFNTLTSHGV